MTAPDRGLKLLWDARHAAEAALTFVNGRSYEDYLTDLMLRSAVERQLITVGEALANLRKQGPELAARVPDASYAIGFRNVLVHGYDTLDDQRVWDALRTSLPVLVEDITRVMDELGDDGT